jgi:hypothetical protein
MEKNVQCVILELMNMVFVLADQVEIKSFFSFKEK